jgi:hypothetical protein
MLPLEFEGKAVLAIVVPYGTQKPYFAGAAYIREGSSSIPASAKLYDELILSHHSKARKLLEFRRDHTVISVCGVNYRLGSLRPMQGGADLEGGEEHKVLECDGHTVRFERLYDRWFFNESVSRLSIEFDTSKNKYVVNVFPPSGLG